VKRIVEASDFDRDTSCEPMVVPPPALLSTITFLPVDCRSASANTRAGVAAGAGRERHDDAQAA
jgi:hypothetical protein